MVFIEKPFIAGKIIHEKSLQESVVTFICIQTQAIRNAVSIGIDYEYRLLGSIEDYRISGLLPDPVDREKFAAKL